MGNNSHRIRYNVNEPVDHIKVKLDQDFDFLEVLSLKINQEDVYKLYTSDYGVLIGRVLANDGFGIPNAKISLFVKSNEENGSDNSIKYPYKSTSQQNADGIRYNLLTSQKVNKCHQNVGTFPTKRELLDNDINEDIFDTYYEYTTTTNESGDYMLFGIPVGVQELHVDIDLSDIGTLSQTPRDMVYKGYNIKQFENPNKFKKSTNLDSLPQIITQNTSVYIYPFWGDENEGEIGISSKIINIQYKFEPTCVFIGSIFTDPDSAAISKTCRPDKNTGKMDQLTTSQGTIEMIRKTIDGQIERFDVNGGRLIDQNGVWCYQIPMNLNYVTTDEFGNTTPSLDPSKGLPTRADVRFRVTLDGNNDKYQQIKTASYLIPNNPKNIEEEDYNFNSETKDSSFVTLLWDKVYTIKNYIPRVQKNTRAKEKKHTGLKGVNFHETNSPAPYNTLSINITLKYAITCSLTQFLISLVGRINRYIIGFLNNKFIKITGLDKISAISISKDLFGDSECINSNFKGNPEFFVPIYKGRLNDVLTNRNKSMTIISCLNKIVPNLNKDYDITNQTEGCFSGYDCGGGAIVDGGKQILQITEGGVLIGCSGDTNITQYLDTTTAPRETDGGYKWYTFNTFVAFETTGSTREPQLTKKLFDCIEIELAGDSEVISFNFSNDWINGSLFAPKYLTKTKKSRNGLAPKTVYCGNKTYSNLYLTKACATSINNNGQQVPGENELCLDNSFLPFLNKRCVEQVTSKQIQRGGLIQRNFEQFYYKSREFYDGMLGTTLFSTDIVLIGGLKSCDKDGIPNLHYLIPPTTFKIPQDVVEYVEGSDTSVELTGIDWGNLDITTNKEWHGLYTSIGCFSADTLIKSCVNAERQCELGVDFDQRQEIDDSTVILPNGYIDNNDISDSDTKAMFSTLNINELETKIENGLIKYNLNYNYPESFDGKLRAVSVSTDLPSSEYIKFRFGSTQPVYYDATYKFPKYNNSFYFYFGLKLGSTAIEQFNSQFFAPCEAEMDEIYVPNYTYSSEMVGYVLEEEYEAEYIYTSTFEEHVDEEIEILPPQLTTNDVSNIVMTGATCGGNITSDGGQPITLRGVCWSTGLTPTTGDTKTVNGSGTGSYTSNITGLTSGVEYNVRAYATNGLETAYGDTKTFTTYIPNYTYSSEMVNYVLEEEYEAEYIYTSTFEEHVDEEIEI